MDIGRTTPTHVNSGHGIDVAFDALARLCSDGLAMIGANGEVLAWSEAAATMTGITANIALESPLTTLFSNAEELLLATEGPARTILRPTSRPEVELRSTAMPISGGYLLSFGAQRHFEQIEQLKNELLSTISHEFKTPLATIKAFATTLRANPNDATIDRDDYLHTIDREADRLARAIDGVLRAARVDADQLLRRRERLAFDRVLEEALAELHPEIDSHPIERTTLGVDICGDPDLLREILVHVLRNAAMFSSVGAPIEVRGLMLGSSTAISIRDRGIGIDTEHLPYVFERFYRAEPKMTASTSGTGLGLFIVRALVRAHGGSITIESTLGSGTLVTLTFPVRA